jgi:CheY-like chemotaxis protein
MSGVGDGRDGDDPLDADVLLIEDNPADVRLVSEAFARFDREVGVVGDGRRGLELLRSAEGRDRPRIVLLDLGIPGLSGHDLLSALTGDPDLDHPPVVVLSNSRADEDVRAAYAAHANAYVAKPTDLEGFEAAIEAIDRFWIRSARTP